MNATAISVLLGGMKTMLFLLAARPVVTALFATFAAGVWPLG
jgi:hypothetical protein